MAKDIALNKLDHGIQFGTKIDSASGETLHTIALVDDAERVAQGIKIRLKTFLGEWFMDTTYGLPYIGTILGKNPKTSVLNSIFRNAILSVNGVSSIVALTLELQREQRVLTVTFQAETKYGRSVNDTVNLEMRRE